MSARSRMTHRVLVQRATTVDDEYGMPGPSTWATHIASLACWFWQRAEREVMDTNKTAIVEDLRMIVPKGTDLSEKDRINGVTDRRGTVIRTGLMGIESVISRRQHLELALRGIAS